MTYGRPVASRSSLGRTSVPFGVEELLNGDRRNDPAHTDLPGAKLHSYPHTLRNKGFGSTVRQVREVREAA